MGYELLRTATRPLASFTLTARKIMGIDLKPLLSIDWSPMPFNEW
jgi:hypothetical protein